MINRKLAAALMVPVMAASIGMAQAGGSVPAHCEDCEATAIITGKLTEECQLIFEAGNVGAIINPTTGALDTAFSPKFKLVSNTDRKLLLTATVEDNFGLKKNALSLEGGKEYIALGNTKTGKKPTDSAINNCIGAAPVAATNKDCIAYEVVSVAMSGASSGNLVFNNSQHEFETSAIDPAKPGTSYITLTTSTAARANTYTAADDVAGDYKAEITLSAVEI